MKKLSKLFLFLMAFVMTFGVTGCSVMGFHSVTCIIEQFDYKERVFYDEMHPEPFPVPEYEHYTFLGYYTEDGELISYLDGEAKDEYKDQAGLFNKLYGYYTANYYPIKINGVDKNVQYGASMPYLEEATLEDHDLTGYKMTQNDKEVVVADGLVYREQYEKLNDEYYDLTKPIEIVPIFTRKNTQMTFVYNLDGEEQTVTKLVSQNVDIRTVAPKYVDENGVEHNYAWQTKENYDLNNHEYYLGNSQNNLTLYANKLMNAYPLEKHPSFYAYEIYKEDVENVTLIVPSLTATNKMIELGLEYKVAKHVRNIDFMFLSTVADAYREFSIRIDNENTNLTINLDDGIKEFIGLKGKGFISYIDGATENNNLTLNMDGSVNIYGGNGIDGKDAINRNYIALNDEPTESAYSPGYGTKGASAVGAGNLKINLTEGTDVVFMGGNGGNGGRGGDTHHSNRNGEHIAPDASNGSDGLKGGSGASVNGTLTLNAKGNIAFIGGNGGKGGDGGNGGNGYGGIANPDSGGDGGNAGKGGEGGDAIYIKGLVDVSSQTEKIIIEEMKNVNFMSGKGGNGGNGGNGGSAEKATWAWHDDGRPGKGGNGADAGRSGVLGIASLTPFYEYGTASVSYPNEKAYGGNKGMGGASDGDYGYGDNGVDGKDVESECVFLR